MPLYASSTQNHANTHTTMTTILTHDKTGGTYTTKTPGGVFGARRLDDRRYWTAWAATGGHASTDCYPGVMDDFGTLVPVPKPPHPPQY